MASPSRRVWEPVWAATGPGGKACWLPRSPVRRSVSGMRAHITVVVGVVMVVVAIVAIVAVGCATPPPPSANASPSGAANGPPEAFDFTGTTWRAELINGVPVAAAQAPTLVVDAFGRDSAGGWTGCEDYGVGMSFESGAVIVGDFVGNTGTCDGATAQLEGAYIQMLRGEIGRASCRERV